MAGDPSERAALEAARLELLGRLLPAALHELANPLLALGGTVELLVADSEAGRQRERLELVQQTAAELSDVVRALQRLAREHQEPARAVELGAFVRETAALAVRFSNVKDVASEVAVETDATVDVEPGVLRQAVLALVLEAVRSAPGGGRVGLAVGGTTIRVSHGSGGGAPAATAAKALGASLEALPAGGAELRLPG